MSATTPGPRIPLTAALFNRYQLVLVAGAVGLSFVTASPLPLLILLGLEVLVLPSILRNTRLARAYEARRSETQPGASPARIRLGGEGLNFEYRERFQKLQALAAMIEKSHAQLPGYSQPLVAEQRAKLDQLLRSANGHLKALKSFDEIARSGASAQDLAAEIQELERKVADPAASPAVRSAHEEALSFKRRLVESVEKSREARETILSQLDALETVLQILARESTVVAAPDEVSARLDELVRNAETTSETVRELEGLARSESAATRPRAAVPQGT